ncbi:MAG: SGNH/GDSL hydrolase family protein [Clostridia bacterium]|nr:SGNH/GDSL hydrolase family protein [Clostridia bacterium]
MRKLTIKLLVIILLLSCVFILFSCKNISNNHISINSSNQEQSQRLKYLVLGDSIAEAIAGPSPLSERDYYGYCSVIGKINNFEYHNRSVSGAVVSDLYEDISTNKDTDGYMLYTLLKSSDIIQISIMGNDLMNNSDYILQNIPEYGYTKYNELVEYVYSKIDEIVIHLKELNPNAVILMQTLYNPYVENSEIFPNWLKDYLYENAQIDMIEEVDKLIYNANHDIFYKYLENNPGAFEIVDVYQQFKDRASQVGNNRLIYFDTIHPSNEGHANIITATQNVLDKLGLSDSNAISNYKEMKIEQLNRLFSDTTVNITNCISQINSSNSIDTINTAYFNSTNNVKPKYKAKVGE